MPKLISLPPFYFIRFAPERSFYVLRISAFNLEDFQFSLRPSASPPRRMAITLKPENVAQLVFFVRGEKVMLDADLAMLYGVEARALNQAVARNRKRFPADFMFRLSAKEYESLRSQIVIAVKSSKDLNSSQSVMSSRKHRGRAYRPYAFTEQGVAMLSSVLRSDRAG